MPPRRHLPRFRGRSGGRPFLERRGAVGLGVVGRSTAAPTLTQPPPTGVEFGRHRLGMLAVIMELRQKLAEKLTDLVRVERNLLQESKHLGIRPRHEKEKPLGDWLPEKR